MSSDSFDFCAIEQSFLQADEILRQTHLDMHWFKEMRFFVNHRNEERLLPPTQQVTFNFELAKRVRAF